MTASAPEAAPVLLARRARGGPASPVLAEVRRSGVVEGVHRGSLVALAADGSVEHAAGDIGSPRYVRSSGKPMQAAVALAAGADLEGELLALAAASHTGERFHVDAVQAILDRAGLSPDLLGCPPELPLDIAERLRIVREGIQIDRRLTMNCSGKHAAMLAACVAGGWPVEGYLDPGHPLQQAVRAEIGSAAGEAAGPTGVDGCGAPADTISLLGLARAFRAYVLAEPGTARRRVADAMRAHPEYVGGTTNRDTAVMQAVPGALCKAGAEAVQAVALPDGRAVAFKVDDGADRAVGPVLVEVLRRLGSDSPALERLAAAPVLGGGAPVGAVVAVLPA